MPTQNIASFKTNFIAVKKQTHEDKYYLFTFCPIRQHWYPYVADLTEPLTKHYTNQIPSVDGFIFTAANVSIKFKGRAANTTSTFVTLPYYLCLGTKEIVILRKSPSHVSAPFRASLKKREYELSSVGGTARNLTAPLWVLAAPQPQPQQPLQPLQTNTNTYLRTVRTTPPIKQALPRRIAWILAEDASKKGDVCPITMDPISPLTASVTSCFHVFQTNALQMSLQHNPECPVCREPSCSVTKAYEEDIESSDETVDVPLNESSVPQITA